MVYIIFPSSTNFTGMNNTKFRDSFFVIFVVELKVSKIFQFWWMLLEDWSKTFDRIGWSIFSVPEKEISYVFQVEWSNPLILLNEKSNCDIGVVVENYSKYSLTKCLINCETQINVKPIKVKHENVRRA